MVIEFKEYQQLRACLIVLPTSKLVLSVTHVSILIFPSTHMYLATGVRLHQFQLIIKMSTDIAFVLPVGLLQLQQHKVYYPSILYILWSIKVSIKRMHSNELYTIMRGRKELYIYLCMSCMWTQYISVCTIFVRLKVNLDKMSLQSCLSFVAKVLNQLTMEQELQAIVLPIASLLKVILSH